MSKVDSIFQKLNIVVSFLLLIEFIVLFSNIDLFPIFLMGISCGLVIFLKRKNSDVIVTSENTEKQSIKTIIFFIIYSLFVTLVFVCFLLYTPKVLGLTLLNIFNTNKLVRFIFYGLLFPFIIGFFISWCWTNEKPIHKNFINLISFPKVLLGCFIFGLCICIFWENYINIAGVFLQLF